MTSRLDVHILIASVCRPSYLGPQRIRWPRHCCPMVSHFEYRRRMRAAYNVTDKTGQTDRQTEGHQTDAIACTLSARCGERKKWKLWVCLNC